MDAHDDTISRWAVLDRICAPARESPELQGWLDTQWRRSLRSVKGIGVQHVSRLVDLFATFASDGEE